MADHAHKQIRTAVGTALTGLATTGARVYADLGRTMAAADLPGLRYGEADESAVEVTVHAPAMQERVLSLDIDACVKGIGSPDNNLDQIAKEVEVALAAGIAIGAVTLPCRYRGMTRSREDADETVGVKRLRYEIPFHTLANAPDSIL